MRARWCWAFYLALAAWGCIALLVLVIWWVV
jgi:hypothetical protein